MLRFKIKRRELPLRSLPVEGADDATLRDLASREGLALRPDELRKIAATLGRNPSIVEVHAFDAQWSEHCSYKSSRHLLKALPTQGSDVVLGPSEDSGILHLGEHNGERYGIVIAHESHNHPSQVVPFEGAATGIGGIVRDVLCMGAEVIAVADPLRFGRVGNETSQQHYIARAVVDGIASYGNAIGVPTIAGDCYFHEGFDDNCLVNVVALGLVKESEIIHSFVPPGSDGWNLVLVGKATDPSGFGGASFSSITLDAEDAEANKGAVQVPDPFLKNVVMRASYRVFSLLRERKLTVGFKDLGAGGIMGCSAELTSSGGYGARIDLDAVNVALPGLAPEVIAIGETQERLLWAIPPEITPEILAMYNDEYSLPDIAFNARAVVIGTVTQEPRYILTHSGETVMDVDIDILTGSIRDELPYDAASPMHEPQTPPPPRKTDVLAMLPRVLAHHDVCSREPLYRHYDGVVRGRTVLERGAADAGVLAPIWGSRLGMALSVDGNPRYGAIDPGRAAEHAIYESIRNVVATGATPIGLTDCLNFGNPRNRAHYSQLVQAIDGLAQAARSFGLAFVSGNVSLYNEASSGAAIPASPIVACLGRIADISRVVTIGFKAAGSPLYLVGARQPWLGGSVFAELENINDEYLASIPYDTARREHVMLLAAMNDGLITSAHDISDGGIATTIAEMCFGSNLGAHIDDPTTAWGKDLGSAGAWFGEAGGFVIEAGDDAMLRERYPELCRHRIGTVHAAPMLQLGDESIAVSTLFAAWSNPLAELYP